MNFLQGRLALLLQFPVALKAHSDHLSGHEVLRQEVLVNLQAIEFFVEQCGDGILHVAHCEVEDTFGVGGLLLLFDWLL
jgi:hypothetical protein